MYLRTVLLLIVSRASRLQVFLLNYRDGPGDKRRLADQRQRCIADLGWLEFVWLISPFGAPCLSRNIFLQSVIRSTEMNLICAFF
jgi:hypothetical protein